MNIEKKYGFIVIAIIMLMISGVLFINKSSYAETNISGNSCPNTRIWFDFDDAKEISFLYDENNKITFATGFFPFDLNASPDVYYPDSHMLFTSAYFYNKTVDSYGNVDYLEDGSHTNAPTYSSILMGYLIHDTHFSDDEVEDDYYKQALIFWAMDRLAGFEDDKNYIYDWNADQIIETDVDTIYEDKYDIDEYSSGSYQWKYENNLSAGDKNLLQNSKYGVDMLKYLDKFEQYLDWYINDGENVYFNSITQNDISYHVTNDYIETNLITPNSVGKVYSDNFDSYEVKVSEPLIVVNIDGDEQTEFNAGESFRVKIPISEIENQKIDYSITIEGYYDFYVLDIYRRSDQMRYEYPSDEESQVYFMLQNSIIMRNCAVEKTLNTDLSLEFTQRVGNLNVKVIDSFTGNNLSKAEVTVYDLKGNEVYKYETTDKELNITLPVGEYIVKQTVTPPNYEAQTIQMRVDVTEDGTANAVLENAPLIDVPDTAMNSVIFIVIGGLVVVAGCILLFTNLRKKESH